jgi:hypothetical protein
MSKVQAAEDRRALLQFYSSNTVQFAGFTLSLGVVFLALVQLLLASLGALTDIVHPLVFGAMLGIMVLASLLFVLALYWNRMTFAAIDVGTPGDLAENSMYDLKDRHHRYVMDRNKWMKSIGIGETFPKLVLIPVVTTFLVGVGVGLAYEFLVLIHVI